MVKKRIQGYLCRSIGVLAAVFLCGCGTDFPALSDEELWQTGEYAAMTLLRYDAKNRTRLLSEEEIQQEEDRRAAWEEAVKEYEKHPAPEEETKPENKPGDGGAVNDKDPDVPKREDKLEDFYVLPDGMKLMYAGFQTCKNYLGDENGLIGTEAGTGKDLLVLRFQLTNSGASDQRISFLNDDIYRIQVNKEYTLSPLLTYLEKDLHTFQGIVPSGAAMELVLITEVTQGTNIESLTLRLKNERIECTIPLK